MRLPVGEAGDDTLLVSLPERPFSALSRLPEGPVNNLLAHAGWWPGHAHGSFFLGGGGTLRNSTSRTPSDCAFVRAVEAVQFPKLCL